MKTITPIIMVLLASFAAGQGLKLGDLTKDSEVITPTSEIVAPSVTTKDGFPVFEITVADPVYTEVQVRASITNFEPGFLLLADGVPVYNFIPLVEEPKVAGKWTYRALATEMLASWDIADNRWEITINGNLITFSSALPWDPGMSDTGDWSDAAGINYTTKKEQFVYHTCTTGVAANPTTWGTGASDPDPWVFIPYQNASPSVPEDQFRRQQWNKATSLTSQINTVGGAWAIGNTITFQPSRGNLGASEWMQQNMDKLVWMYQPETAGGTFQTQPNGTPIWHIMHPKEWRKTRITLPTTTP